MKTTREIEIEIKVDNFYSVEKKLKGLEAKLEKEFTMRDVYFDKESFYKNIRIRLRRLNNDKYLLTKKSPSISSKGVQKAEEKETHGIGFEQKYKELCKTYGSPIVDEEINIKIFLLDSVTIELREVKGLFNYIEISGKSEKDVENIKSKLKIEGKVFKEGALNEVLMLRNLPKIVVK
jgi:predicted adenylyl cyclase CyaB